MNKDILKGKWLEIKGSAKEKWSRLNGNYLGAIAGESHKLLGLLQKKHGYIREKAELGYKYSVELAEIVSSIREMMTEKKDALAIAFVARYGQPFLAGNQKGQTAKKKKQGYITDHYFDARLSRRNTHPAI